MSSSTSSIQTIPHRLSNAAGLRAEFNANGSLRRMDLGDVMVNLFLGNETEGGLARLYLRRIDQGNPADWIRLTGPGSAGTVSFGVKGVVCEGEWDGLCFRVEWKLAEEGPAWFWEVSVENTNGGEVTCDLILTHDVGLAHYGAVRLNEFYVSQYVDHTPVMHPEHGVMVASRQNQAMGGQFPWMLIGSLGKAERFATDALQFHGLGAREGLAPEGLSRGLPNGRLQHEHSLVCMQEAPFVIPAGGQVRRGFFGWVEADHPAASSESDFKFADRALAMRNVARALDAGVMESGERCDSLFAAGPFLPVLELGPEQTAEAFGDNWRHLEDDGIGVLSAFCGEETHVVFPGKERQVLRPHGLLMRSGTGWIPDESAMTSTAWMGGVFHSMVTQGHVSINRFLSTVHSYLGLFRSHGQRIFLETAEGWNLLGMPSAFSMAGQGCRWIYRHAAGMLEVRSWAQAEAPELRLEVAVLEGEPVRLLVSHHVALNGDDGSQPGPARLMVKGRRLEVRAVPDSDVGRRFPDGIFVIEADVETMLQTVGGDELLYSDGRSRNEPFVCLITSAIRQLGLTLRGHLVDGAEGVLTSPPAAALVLPLTPPAGAAEGLAALRLAEVYPWFIQNALVHYLSPRGLEQYSGGGWGTRDVCQGPVEMLLALGHFAPLKDVLFRVFSQQNADGDWPQWFMFFERERNIRPGDSHGDIAYWPLLALSQYLAATGDDSILQERLPYFHAEGRGVAEEETLEEHLKRALLVIQARVIEGTKLAAYGHGDWNDSLQPLRPDMRDRLCSSWTVTLNYQVLRALADAFRKVGRTVQAETWEVEAAAVLEEFQDVLVVDGVIAGLVYFHENGQRDLMLHPRDLKTGMRYSLLPMIHALINDMLTPEQAEAHLALIREHLSGPDGARLFDQPMPYRGGLMQQFQRAESAAYFGREIGIMYMHAHLRYCEALARLGEPDAFFHALQQVNPIGMREVVSPAGLRQANCYYSSSDAAFADRYEASAEYGRVREGTVTLEGGWRVYSSGAGISTRLIMHCFLGLRREAGALVIDPMIPVGLDGMTTRFYMEGTLVEVLYRIQKRGCGVTAVELNGRILGFVRESNRYRAGAVRIDWKKAAVMLRGSGDVLTVWLD